MSSAMEQIVNSACALSSAEREELIAVLRSMKAESSGLNTLVAEIRGKYRHIPTSVDAFLRRKSEEAAKESKS